MFNMMSGAEAQAKQNKSLDVALLCKKLEAHKREQDIMRLRRERKSDTKNGKFVPKVAAKQFVATATPARDDTTRRRYHPATLESIAEPYDDRTVLGKSQVYATMRVGVKQQDGVATLVTQERQASRSRDIVKRDSMSPRSSKLATTDHVAGNESLPRDHANIPGSKTPTHFSASGRPKPRVHRRSSSRKEVEQIDRKAMRDSKKTRAPQPEPQPQPQPESKVNDTGLYRPGDAAKRRSMFETSPFADFSGFSGFDGKRRTSIHALQDLTLGQQSLDRPRQSSLPTLAEPERTSLSTQRPKLLPNDRPDWSQRSEIGDSSHAGFHLFGKSKANKVEEKEKEKPGSQDGHLIADAVKMIKQQEKIQRRKSVMWFFKKL